MGEIEFKPNKLVAAVGLAVQQQELEAMRLDTPGGRIHVRWDEGGGATPSGQLVFFAECLEVTGLFSRWVEGCPLNYTSPNAARAKDLLGTWMLSTLDGQNRYAHVAALNLETSVDRLLRCVTWWF
jgi:hypothetical protein